MINITETGFERTVSFYTHSEWAAFRELVQRGANLWPDAPPEIKEFADLVTNGKVLQNYREQNKDQRSPANATDEQIRNKPFVD